MDDPDNSNSSGALDQTNEDIVTYTVSDESLEAAAGTEKVAGTANSFYDRIVRALICC